MKPGAIVTLAAGVMQLSVLGQRQSYFLHAHAPFEVLEEGTGPEGRPEVKIRYVDSDHNPREAWVETRYLREVPQ